MKHTIKTFFTLALALALFGITACKGPSDNNSDGTDEGVPSSPAASPSRNTRRTLYLSHTTHEGLLFSVRFFIPILIIN